MQIFLAQWKNTVYYSIRKACFNTDRSLILCRIMVSIKQFSISDHNKYQWYFSYKRDRYSGQSQLPVYYVNSENGIMKRKFHISLKSIVCKIIYLMFFLVSSPVSILLLILWKLNPFLSATSINYYLKNLLQNLKNNGQFVCIFS